MKVSLDKYYTPIDTAKYCIEKFKSFGFPVSEYIEPSAGDGSFSSQIDGCIAYDIEPENPGIIQQDFLGLDIPHKEHRAVIGNPPFGRSNNLAIQFFLKSVQISDYIAFILPQSMYDNNIRAYHFDCVHTELLPVQEYSGVDVKTCFNVYRRPASGALNKRPNYNLEKLKLVIIVRGRNIKKKELDMGFDYAINAWGDVGEIKEVGKYASEIIFYVDPEWRERVLEVCRRTDWKTLNMGVTVPSIQLWQIYRYIKKQIPEIT